MFSPGYLFVKVCCFSLNTLNSHLNSYIPSSETRGKYICSVFFLSYWKSHRFGSPEEILDI